MHYTNYLFLMALVALNVQLVRAQPTTTSAVFPMATTNPQSLPLNHRHTNCHCKTAVKPPIPASLPVPLPASLDAPLPVPPPHVVQRTTPSNTDKLSADNSNEHSSNTLKQKVKEVVEQPPEPTPPSETSVKPEPVLLGDKSQFRYAAAKFDIYGVVGYMHFTYNGTITLATINITAGLPRNEKEGYFYHLHQKPVPANGNCTETTGHLDPFHVNPTPGKPYPCDPHDFRTCEVGDLSGKHGLLQPVESEGHSWLTGTKPITFLDPQLDWSNQPDVSIFYGRSINIHRPSDLTRYSCANLVETNQDWEPLGNFNGSSQVPTSTAQNLQSSATNSSAMMYHFTNSKWLMISLWSIMTTLVSSHYLFY